MMKYKNVSHDGLFERLDPAGFTLIEMIIAIAILSIMAGAMAPMAVQMIGNSRREATLKRQQSVYQAIWGDPELHGTGFLSDIGRIPNGALTELAVRGNLPSYAVQACGVGMGWRGPYLLDGVDGAGRPLDAWGTPMDFANGQIRSAGPDQIMNTAADNLYYPSTPVTANNINGSIALDVKVLDTSTPAPAYVPAAGPATIYYAQNGQMQSVNAASAAAAAGVSLHQGIHAITVTRDLDGPGGPMPPLTGTITVFCPAGGTVHQTIFLR
jgi:prepilin-type N-terminal cleavage/methylation domain-containing protein